MSHIPLLSRHSAPPRLQSPRRGPQACCLCLLLGALVIVAHPPLLYAHVYNATRVAAPPPELQRLVESGADARVMENGDGSLPVASLHDLLVTVRYLANRALELR
jgi:hypothetical protein